MPVASEGARAVKDNRSAGQKTSEPVEGLTSWAGMARYRPSFDGQVIRRVTSILRHEAGSLSNRL